jgi:hypothetical protein
MDMKKIVILFCVVALLTLTACSTHVHKIGTGAATGNSSEARQWYALWGLVPINTVNTVQMAGTYSDYEIKTEQSVIDILLNFVTGFATIYSRTVTVTN